MFGSKDDIASVTWNSFADNPRWYDWTIPQLYGNYITKITLNYGLDFQTTFDKMQEFFSNNV